MGNPRKGKAKAVERLDEHGLERPEPRREGGKRDEKDPFKKRGNESESETRKKRKERWQIQKKREAPIVLGTKVCTHGHHDGDSQRTIKILGHCI